jgi:hypothetical protein
MAPLSLKAPTAEVLSVIEDERVTDAEFLTRGATRDSRRRRSSTMRVYWACETRGGLARIDKAQPMPSMENDRRDCRFAVSGDAVSEAARRAVKELSADVKDLTKAGRAHQVPTNRARRAFQSTRIANASEEAGDALRCGEGAAC